MRKQIYCSNIYFKYRSKRISKWQEGILKDQIILDGTIEAIIDNSRIKKRIGKEIHRDMNKIILEITKVDNKIELGTTNDIY